MGEIGDGVALHREVDRDGRAAQLGMGGRAWRPGVASRPSRGMFAGELEDPLIVDLVDHGSDGARIPDASSGG